MQELQIKQKYLQGNHRYQKVEKRCKSHKVDAAMHCKAQRIGEEFHKK